MREENALSHPVCLIATNNENCYHDFRLFCAHPKGTRIMQQYAWYLIQATHDSLLLIQPRHPIICFNVDSIYFILSGLLDDNECSTNNGLGPCEHICVNTLLGHECLCSPGYTLNNDGTTCAGGNVILTDRPTYRPTDQATNCPLIQHLNKKNLRQQKRYKIFCCLLQRIRVQQYRVSPMEALILPALQQPRTAQWDLGVTLDTSWGEPRQELV